MPRGVLEAGDLAVLRRQVEDRVEDEVDERELAVDTRRRHVAGDGLDPLRSRLRGEAGQHRPGAVDADDAHPALGQGQRNPPGADRELERPPVAGEGREPVDGRPDDGRIEMSAESRS
jgi:hypothetical protein